MFKVKHFRKYSIHKKMSSSPPPAVLNQSFDEINLTGPPPPAPPRRSFVSNQPAFYSLTHGFSIDEEDEEEEQHQIGDKMPTLTGETTQQNGTVHPAKPSAAETNGSVPNSPPPTLMAPYPLSVANLSVDLDIDDGHNAGHTNGHEEVPMDEAGKKPSVNENGETINLECHHSKGSAPGKHSPPPLYTTTEYPPGIYPAMGPAQVPPCYGAPPLPPASQNGLQQQQQHQVPAAYIIDASVLNGMPAVLIRGNGGQCGGGIKSN
jgi:hypothetical protein